MSLSEEKEINAATDSFSEAVVVFNNRDYKKAATLFSELIKKYSDSEYFTVLEIVGKAKSYASMAEMQTEKGDEPVDSQEDFIATALINLNAGRLHEALDLLGQTQSKHGQNAKLHYLAALIYARLNQDDKSLEALQLSINADKKYKTIAYNEPDFERFIENQTFRTLTA